ncbi:MULTISPECIES: histidine--tRNA ligase [Bacillus cereus group]|nr:histidine--tRNA ligase [Bacillus thuringiensis]
MNMLKNIKGTQDYLPEEQVIRNKIKKVLEETFEIYGFKPIETPIINYQSLMAFKYGGGEEILKEIYTLSDQGDRNLALRYDLTIPFAKIIGMNPKVRLPFKRYEIGKVFRDGPIKKGRLREFTQCDVDVVGIESVSIEADLMALAVDVFEKLNLNIKIEFNNRKLLVGILEYLGVKDEDISGVILSVDKIKKIGIEGIKEELLQKNIDSSTLEKIEELFNDSQITNLDYIKNKFNNDQVLQGVNEVSSVMHYLNAIGISNYIEFNPFLARGLNIYTGSIYEIFLQEGTITSSIGSGGRYDEIIGKFINEENKFYTVGLSFGLDVIYTALLDKYQEELKKQTFLDLFILPIGNVDFSLKLAKKIRNNYNLKVDIELKERKLKKSLDYVNKENIPYVLFLGDSEIEKGIIRLKDMKSGEEKEILLKEIDEGKLLKYIKRYEER